MRSLSAEGTSSKAIRFLSVSSLIPHLEFRSGNLPDGYPDKSLRELFERYGEVTECDVLKNFGFVHFRKPEEAEKAKDGLVNHTIEGKKIRVESSGSGRGGSSSAAGTKLFVGMKSCMKDSSRTLVLIRAIARVA